LGVSRTPDEVFLLVFGGIAVILVTARLLGRLFHRLGQPAVVGEVVGGLVLGPSLLGLMPGDPSAVLFPGDIQPYLRVIAQFGLIIYLFIVGLELDTRALAGNRKAAVSISLSSILVPFALGATAGLLLHSRHDETTRLVGAQLVPATVELVPFALFCGLAIAGSAFAILARILDERRLFQTRLGSLIMGSTVVDDVAVWTLAAVVLAVAASADLTELPVTMGGLALFVAFLLGVVRPALDRHLTSRYERVGHLNPDLFAVILVGLLVSAMVTTQLGISPILGAFLFGAALPRRRTAAMFREVNERLEALSVLVLLPVFFVVTGLGVDIGALGWEGLATLVLFIAIATTGKMLGAYIGASTNGIQGRRALGIGVLMNTRGLTELAILSLGRDLGVLDPTMFTVLVCTAIATTLISGPLLRLVYPDHLIAQDIEDAERARLAETDAYRVLVVIDDPERDGRAVDLATALARSEPGSEVVLSRICRVGPRSELGSGFVGDLGLLASSLEELAALTSRVSAAGVRAVPQSRFSDDPVGALLPEVARMRPNLVLIPATHPLAGQLADRIVTDARVDVVVAADVGGAPPPVVVVGTGAEPHQSLAGEVALRLALAWQVPVSVTPARRGRQLRPLIEAAGVTVVDDGGGGLRVAADPADTTAPLRARAAAVATGQRSFDRLIHAGRNGATAGVDSPPG
jgi:Kef-type K+ transport system membrane component KefB